jgi:hypothetical protein
MTLSEMLRRSADMLEQSNDRTRALMAVEHILDEVRGQLYRERPGLEIDRLIGTKEKIYG